MKIQIILGSTRQGRFGDKPAQWIFEKTAKLPGVEAELLDLREHPLPFFDEPVSPGMSDGKYANPEAAKWAKKIGEADAYIIVAAEYNHGYTAVLKNALDYVYKEWNNKPVAFVSYGGAAGGARAVEQLRQVVVELQMTPIRATVLIPMYWSLLDEQGGLNTETLEEGGDKMLEQLVSWAKTLKASKK